MHAAQNSSEKAGGLACLVESVFLFWNWHSFPIVWKARLKTSFLSSSHAVLIKAKTLAFVLVMLLGPIPTPLRLLPLYPGGPPPVWACSRFLVPPLWVGQFPKPQLKGALSQYGCRGTAKARFSAFSRLALPATPTLPSEHFWGWFTTASIASRDLTVTGVYPDVLSRDKLLTACASFFFK